MERGWLLLVICIFFLFNTNEVLGNEKDSFNNAKLHSGSESTESTYSTGSQKQEKALPRQLFPPYPLNTNYDTTNDNQNIPKLSQKMYIFYRPIPLSLVHKSTIVSGPVDEELFRQVVKETRSPYSGNDDVARNEVSSTEFPDSDTKFQRRTLLSPPHQPQFQANSLRGPIFHFLGDQTPITASIRGFIATPGRRIQKISGTPMQLLEKTYFKDKRIDLNDPQLVSSSSASMTVIPAIVRSFPLQITPANRDLQERFNLDLNLSAPNEYNTNGVQFTNQPSNTIFKRYTPHPPNTISRNGFRIPRNSLFRSIDVPNKLKIIIFSKMPSENQPLSFWKKLLRVAPRLPHSSKLSRVLSNVIPQTTQRTTVRVPSRRVQTILHETKTPSVKSSQTIFLPPFQSELVEPEGTVDSAQTFAGTNSAKNSASGSLRSIMNPDHDFSIQSSEIFSNSSNNSKGPEIAESSEEIFVV